MAQPTSCSATATLGVVVSALTLAPTAFVQTVHPWGTNPCPPAADTTSLLQSQDPAFGDMGNPRTDLPDRPDVPIAWRTPQIITRPPGITTLSALFHPTDRTPQ